MTSQGENGLQVRMTFNSAINKRDEMQLRIENNGTTSMSFQWNKIPTPPKFSIIQKDEVQRFYFNIGDGDLFFFYTEYPELKNNCCTQLGVFQLNFFIIICVDYKKNAQFACLVQLCYFICVW